MAHPTTTPTTEHDAALAVAALFGRSETPRAARATANRWADAWLAVGRPDLADATRTEAGKRWRHAQRTAWGCE